MLSSVLKVSGLSGKSAGSLAEDNDEDCILSKKKRKNSTNEIIFAARREFSFDHESLRFAKH